MKVQVNEASAMAVAAALQTIRAEAAAGRGDLPALDFNHDGQAASAHVEEVFWAGNDPVKGGTVNGLDWTKTEAVLGPWLELGAEKKQFVGRGDLVATANQLVTRQYRPPFPVPENV